ncbi:uncharacterized protein FOMMEDRAFT_142507 [Fomitiporia mediterranea MF3/22]|uniref:uncharacterized protein n=1 Tax=Fomitiporia mediterranea (strain MF3/22) TaxID=694068 RepID=UPI0004409AFB|nr:uncharacterized protein FOMMEDRAFT_142507 [Fomitiporia mediterranea MF3/22]EJD00019.1 hypothetical protein FOMMEDRAFT_142507 [Fomitiporia mediterranea MF3/22]
MSSTVDYFNAKPSAPAEAVNTRHRSASVSAHHATPELDNSNSHSNVHVSVSVSLSESLASISAWASQIVPGSPPSAPSPRRSSFCNVSPKTSRRSTISATFLNFWDSPSPQPQTPAPKPVSPADLLAHGYTSIFVHLPSLRRGSDYSDSPPDSPTPVRKTENAPLPLPRPQPRPRTKSLTAENKKEKPGTATRLRSLSFKAKKSKPSEVMPGFNVPPMPALPTYKSSGRPTSPRSKKPKSTPQSRYGAILGPGNGTGALPLAQEVALAQMLDGGSLDANVKRVTERHARATGAHSKTSVRDEVYKGDRKDRRPIEKRDALEREGKVGGGVTGIYRDQNGGLWWDEDESLELTGLLPSSDVQTQTHHGQMPLGNSSVHNQEKEKRRGLLPRLMTSAKPPPTTSLPAPPSWVPLHSPSAAKPGRKGSASDASTDGEDLDLDPAYAVRPRDSSTLFPAGYSMSAERERHLRRAPRGIEAFGVSPLDSSSSSSHSGPRERRERKRPAPLTLPLPLPTPHAPATASTATARTSSRPNTAQAPPPLPTSGVLIGGPTREEREGRQEFFASTFAPAPYPTSARPAHTAHASPQPQQNPQTKPKAARRTSLSLGLSSFGIGAGSKHGRRASVASASPTSPITRIQANAYPGSYANGSQVALSKTYSRPGTAQGVEKVLKTKASRSRLAGLFKRG